MDIRFFVNSLGLEAYSVEEANLFSVRFCLNDDDDLLRLSHEIDRWKAENFSKLLGYNLVGSYRDKESLTIRYVRVGSDIQRLPIPKNWKELGLSL